MHCIALHKYRMYFHIITNHIGIIWFIFLSKEGCGLNPSVIIEYNTLFIVILVRNNKVFYTSYGLHDKSYFDQKDLERAEIFEDSNRYNAGARAPSPKNKHKKLKRQYINKYSEGCYDSYSISVHSCRWVCLLQNSSVHYMLLNSTIAYPRPYKCTVFFFKSPLLITTGL